ncbi:hypothetical protein ABIE18_004457 [Arthrobacter sp. 2762]
MSFDVYFQGFRDGGNTSGGGEIVRLKLEPYIVREDPAQNFAYVEYGDGSIDVYLNEDSMVANHVVGEEPWKLLFDAAQAADWVILPVGCPTCITDEAQRRHLPEELDAEVAVVSSGEDLLRIIRSL